MDSTAKGLQPSFQTLPIREAGPGKLFRDCIEAEHFKRVNHARKLLHKALAPWDERLRGKGDFLGKGYIESDG